jgi:hypothetical protein
MTKGASTGLVGVIALVIASAAAFGVFGVRSTTEVDDAPPPSAPHSDGTGVVYGRRESGGMSFVGVRLAARDYTVDVAFVPPAGCVPTLDDDREMRLDATGSCAAAPASGPVAGSGRTPLGETLMIVRVKVSKECYEAVAPGRAWPLSTAECR